MFRIVSHLVSVLRETKINMYKRIIVPATLIFTLTLMDDCEQGDEGTILT
jgi:hypothetical protein